MQTPEISLILPVRDIEIELPGILRSVKEQVGTAAEWIIVDMGSEDQTVLRAVQYIKEEKLHGFVIQNGKGSVSAALNTGMQKAAGEYLSFVFARRLYGGYLSTYLEAARAAQADFVFGGLDANSEQPKGKTAGGDGPWYVQQMVQGRLRVDIAALLLRKSFLQTQKLYFQEDCSHGYSEEFIYCCLLSGAKVARAPIVLERRRELELFRAKAAPAGREIFQAIEAMLRVQAVIENRCPDNQELCESFEERKLPETVMNCVDVLLRGGLGYNTVRGYLRVEGYDRLLTLGKRSGRALRSRIRLWQLIPWVYRPQ
ncbi:glycosyltransferase family 2 protein [Faecalispora anaeroviscerum]|uniref:glycosyltransferase family 2 protein n=1 Tax=Faecalispora anaeroviscerum TaxID=2991836 RepID=UPI0024BBCCE3|nr:glycosyltransferase [Faecalispora anaeroviscerum]